MNDDANEINNDGYKVNSETTTTSKPIKCKTRIIGSTSDMVVD